MYKLFYFLVILSFIKISDTYACTSAIIGAELNPSGRPLLWKNRDTSNIDNIVEYIKPEGDSFGYVALFNASDKNLEQSWIGMNQKGFAIMNTASYNIKSDSIPESEMDKEGYIMTIALKSCQSVEDFENLLQTLPKPLGVEANFGVIDAWGNGAFFETNNFDFIKFDLKDSNDHLLIRTNYSHSGRENEGYGFIREANAEHLLEEAVRNKTVTPDLLTENLSRSFWHDLLNKDLMKTSDLWIIDQDFIPRFKSTSTIVIEGCHPIPRTQMPDEEFIKNQYIMWTGMGYPPCSEILPVLCTETGVPEILRGTMENGHCLMGDIVKARRDEVFPYHYGNGDRYINKRVLINDEGTGYIQTLVPKNLKVYKEFSEKRDHGQLMELDRK